MDDKIHGANAGHGCYISNILFANNYDFKGMRFKKTPVNDTASKTKKKYLDDRMFSIYDRKGIFVKYSAQSKKQIKFSFE